MALAYDATGSGSALPDTSITFSHTCTGSNLILIVGVNIQGVATDTVTGVTYNGAAMSAGPAAGLGGGNNIWGSTWYLINPATGAHDVVVSSSSSGFMRAISVSYTGAKQSAQPDASNTFAEANLASPKSLSVTTVADNSWDISVIGGSGADDKVAGSGIGAERATVGNYLSYGDSNAAITPAGSHGMSWSWTDAQHIIICQLSIAPVEATTTSTSTSTTSTSSSTSTTSTSTSSSTSSSTSTTVSITTSTSTTSTSTSSSTSSSTSTSTTSTSTSSSTSSSTSTTSTSTSSSSSSSTSSSTSTTSTSTSSSTSTSTSTTSTSTSSSSSTSSSTSSSSSTSTSSTTTLDYHFYIDNEGAARNLSFRIDHGDN